MSKDLKKRIKDLEDLVEQLDKTLNLYRELSYINLPVVDLVHQANKMGKEMTAKEISEFIFLRSNDRIKRYALLLHNPSIKLTPRETQYVEMMR